MTFLRPDLWWVAVVALVAILSVRRLMRRRVLAVTTFSLMSGRGFRASRFRVLPSACVALSLAVVLTAILRPVIPIAEREVQQRGLDIVLVVDLSLSTTQPLGFKYQAGAVPADAPPGTARIDAIKTALKDFLGRRPDDRIGVVVFSDHAYVVSPLTFDKEHLLGYFNLIDPSTLFGEGMTAVGDGVDMAVFLLNRQSTAELRKKVVIVFTDGNSNMGRDPVQSIADANSEGIRVHIVGVDLEEEEKRHPEVGQLIARVREGGGQYYAASSIADLETASSGLDQLEKGYLMTKIHTRDEPVVRWFALAAVAILLVAVGLRALPIFIGLH
jgi:Ca-activated chloride channel family protein